MRTSTRALTLSALALLLGACGSSSAPQVQAPPTERKCQGYSAQRNPYFGDLHVHTTYSLDANTQGTIVGPHDAYRFARGERLGVQPYDAQGNPTRYTQLSRPLDFAAVTDHAELFGETERAARNVPCSVLVAKDEDRIGDLYDSI